MPVPSRLIFLNRYFHPDHSATSQMLSDLAFALAERGRRVAIITSRQLYDAPENQLPARETIAGVEVHRVWTSRFGRHNLAGRAIDYLTFYLSSAWRLWRLAHRGDVVIAKTDPPMLSVLVAPIARTRRAHLVNWLQDIFPEVAEELGVGTTPRWRVAYGIMRVLRNRSLKRAQMNIAIGQRMADRLTGLGVARERIRVIPNWADGALVTPREHATNALRRDWGLEGKFVVGYSGNLGRAHEFGTLIEAIASVEADSREALATEVAGPVKSGRQIATSAIEAAPPAAHGHDIVWLFIGGGALYRQFEAEIRLRNLTSVQFRPYQPRERLAESLSAADIHLVSLRPELEGLIVPSKYYGIAAAGRPAIFIGDKDGEIARILADEVAGYTLSPGDGTGLAALVRELAGNPELTRDMGRRARAAFDRRFDFAIAVAAWEAVLKELDESRFPAEALETKRLHAERAAGDGR